MTTPTPGRTWVDSSPPLIPSRYGLFSVASFSDGEGPWQNRGVEYYTDHCAQGGYVEGICPAPVAAADLTATWTLAAADGGFTLASDAGSDMTLAYEIRQDGATLHRGEIAPGETKAHTFPDGAYELRTTYRGTSHDHAFTLPLGAATPVTDTFPAALTTHDKNVAGGPELAEGTDPFTVYARVECNAVGFEDPRGMAMRRLGLIEQREVERYASRHLLGTTTRFPLGETTAVSVQRALGALEQDAALNYAGAPTLHAPRWTFAFLEGSDGIDWSDGRDFRITTLGSPVAFGGGYYDNPFAPETALPAGQFWLVATGTVRGWRAAPFANETYSTNNNLRMAMAERTYALDADCYRAAVLVQVEGTPAA